jgi:hypothetical protein
MKKAGNRCELVGYEGQTHGFFNFGRGEKFFETVAEMDRFLASLGYVEGPATVGQFKKSLTARSTGARGRRQEPVAARS